MHTLFRDRTRRGLALVTAALLLGPISAAAAQTVRAGHAAARADLSTRVGVVGASGRHDAQDFASGVRVVTIGVTWAAAEPSAAHFDSAYLAGTRSKIHDARAQGLAVVLDPGIQYPPEWVVHLDPSARFVDQYGQVFDGPPASGNHVVNAVTDLAVRRVLGAYLHWLGTQISASSLLAVRDGGGPMGELRYPDATFDGHDDCYWAYDPSSIAKSPVPGWNPGTGTVAQARQFLDAYNANLVGYGVWLTRSLASDFHTRELVMLPGWGERPGVADREVSSRLTLHDDEFNQGLDWPDLFAKLPDRAHVVAYTTYLDAPSVRATPALEDPAHYIASLAARFHYALGGENTGNGTRSALAVTFARARSLKYFIVNWMDEGTLVAMSAHPGNGPTFADLAAAIHADFGS